MTPWNPRAPPPVRGTPAAGRAPWGATAGAAAGAGRGAAGPGAGSGFWRVKLAQPARKTTMAVSEQRVAGGVNRMWKSQDSGGGAVRSRNARSMAGVDSRQCSHPCQTATCTRPACAGGDANGQGGIRTPGSLAGTPVFKTGALNHSATCPRAASIGRPTTRRVKNYPGARVALPRRPYSFTSARNRRRISGVTWSHVNRNAQLPCA